MLNSHGVSGLQPAVDPPHLTSANVYYIGYQNRLTKLLEFRHTPTVGRPALTDEQVRDKVLAYCRRYDVSPGPEGLPPFPAGQRETPQHREWLTVYRALQRLKARSAGVPAEPSADGSCPVCSRTVSPDDAVAFSRVGRRSRPEMLHPACADLARLAEKAGPEAAARLSAWLWPRRGRRAAP